VRNKEKKGKSRENAEDEELVTRPDTETIVAESSPAA
jgi:hypothetical protein